MAIQSTRLAFNGYEANVSDLPEQSIAALLQLGFSTKIKNAIAGVNAGILGTGKTPWSHAEIEAEAKNAGLSTWGPNEETANAICALYQREMYDSILSGIAPASRTSTPRKISNDDKMRRDIAIELFDAWAKKQDLALPRRSRKDEKQEYDRLLAKALEKPKFAKSVEQEFVTRKAKAAKALDGLDDLLD